MIAKLAQLMPGRKGIRRRRTPTVLQMEAVECGAASLAMILAYHGRFVPLMELRHACGVSRDGSKASNLLKAARHYGLESRGSKKSLRALRNAHLPCVIFWEFGHFLVLEGFHESKQIYYLNDPSQGPRKVSSDEFDEAYTGIALEFSPGPSFERSGSPPRITEALRQRLAGSGAAMVYVVIVSLLMAIIGVLVPAFSKVYVDEYLIEQNTNYLRPLLFFMGATALVQVALVWLQQHYLLRLETKLAVSGSSQFLWHVLRLPLPFFAQRFAGDLCGRVTLANRFAQLLSRDLAVGVLSLINVVFFAIAMLFYDIALTLLALTISACSFVAVASAARVRTHANRRMQNDEGRAVGVAMGGVQIIESLKASGAEADFFSNWVGHQVKVTNARQAIGQSVNLLDVVVPFLSVLTSIAVLGLGSLKVMEGEMSIGVLVAFQALTIGLSGPVNRLVQLSGKIQDASGDLLRLNDILLNPIDPSITAAADEDRSERPDASMSGQVELRNLTFGYSPLEPPLIDGFSLHLTPGRRVALVGGSGSGKSTLAKMVAGICEAWDGDVLFDGLERGAYPRGVVCDSIAMVDQNISVFTGTIRDNLTLWDKTIDEATIVQSAKDAMIHEAIVSRTGGYDSPLTEAGGNFSGGQLQRLEIARALVRNPSILILDEATSAMDPMTEKLVDENIRRRGCTCVIVAHRLSTIRDCDEIIVLERGKVAERGTHEELLRNRANYFQLIRAA